MFCHKGAKYSNHKYLNTGGHHLSGHIKIEAATFMVANNETFHKINDSRGSLFVSSFSEEQDRNLSLSISDIIQKE